MVYPHRQEFLKIKTEFKVALEPLSEAWKTADANKSRIDQVQAFFDKNAHAIEYRVLAQVSAIAKPVVVRINAVVRFKGNTSSAHQVAQAVGGIEAAVKQITPPTYLNANTRIEPAHNADIEAQISEQRRFWSVASGPYVGEE